MCDWLRSLSLLAMAFATVVVVTLGMAGIVVPGLTATAQAPGDGEPADGGASRPGPQAAEGGIPGLGGTLTVSGDREGTFRLTGESVEDFYALEGDGGRIVFGDGSPASIEQISYDGWEFFPDEGDCTLTAGNLDNAIGIGFADLACEGLEDIRDKGTIDLAGEIGMPVDRLAARTLPPSGGTLTVGEEVWTIGESHLATWQQPAIAGVSDYNLELDDSDLGTSLNFYYDIETHRLSAATVVRGGEEANVPADVCQLASEELGKHNPRTTVLELTITCPTVDVPGLGSVPIGGTVVVDELQWPE